MMQTTQDAAVNGAKTVLGYGFPETFDKLTELDAKSMIEQGNFNNLAQRVLHEHARSSNWQGVMCCMFL
jgi:hypothetical protein